MNQTTNYSTNVHFDQFVWKETQMLTQQVHAKLWITLFTNLNTQFGVQSSLVCTDSTKVNIYTRNNLKLTKSMLGTNNEKQEKFNII